MKDNSAVLLEIRFPELEFLERHMCIRNSIRMRFQEGDTGIKTIFSNGSAAAFRTHERYYFTLAIPVGSLMDFKQTSKNGCWTYDQYIHHVISLFFHYHFNDNIAPILLKLEILSTQDVNTLTHFSTVHYQNPYSIFNKSANNKHGVFTLMFNINKHYPVLDFPFISLVLRCMEEFISIFKEYYYSTPIIELQKIDSMLDNYSENLLARLESTGLIESRLESTQKV